MALKTRAVTNVAVDAEVAESMLVPPPDARAKRTGSCMLGGNDGGTSAILFILDQLTYCIVIQHPHLD